MPRRRLQRKRAVTAAAATALITRGRSLKRGQVDRSLLAAPIFFQLE
jgi:hypothetical protein